MASSVPHNENFEDWCMKYEKVKQLIDEESLRDPESVPYRSIYAAIEILKKLREEIRSSLTDDEQQDQAVRALLGVIEFHLGTNYIETEEFSTGCGHLNEALGNLRGMKFSPRAVSISLSTLNQLGILWSQRNEYLMSLEFLTEAADLYKNYQERIDITPLSIDDLFKPDCNISCETHRKQEFDRLYTHTLFYLAQVYQYLDKPQKSAQLCHATLIRQLEGKQYESRDWALNCATLSQYYITQKHFTMARHCLASASRVFTDLEACSMSTGNQVSGLEDANDDDKVANCKADISRCWTKFCILLLEISKAASEGADESVNTMVIDLEEYLNPARSNSSPNTNDCASNVDDEFRDGVENRDKKLALRFQSLELTDIEEQVTDMIVTDYIKAREVFLMAQRHVNIAKEYYCLDGHVSNYIEIVKDVSASYRLLAYFEPDIDRKCKMHKRRIDILQDILKELSVKYFLLECRQLRFELAEVYTEMMCLKIELNNGGAFAVSEHATKKINSLAKQGIEQFIGFIDLLKDNGQLPVKYSDNYVRPALVANFNLGRLYSKIITSDMSVRITNIKKSLEHYQYMVDYCQTHPETVEKVKDELDVCVSMVSLLPARLLQLSNQH